MPARETLPGLNIYERQDILEPLQTRVTLPAEGVVYDVLDQKRVGKADGAAKVEADLKPGGLCLYAALPEAVGGVSLGVPEAVRRGGSIPIRARVVGASSEQTLEGAVPIRIQFLDGEGGRVRQDRWRSTDRGSWRGEFSAGMFDTSPVRIRVREMLTGKSATANIEIKAGDAAPVREVQKPVVVENEQAIGRFFRRDAVYETHTLLNGRRAEYEGLFEEDLNQLYIALGDRAPRVETVRPLARFLRAKGVNVKIRRSSDLAVKGFDHFVGRGLARIRKDVVGPMRGDIEVDRPVIAIGSARDNALIRLPLWDRRWTYRTSLGGFPGKGRAYVAHLWRPFHLRHNAIVAVADDRKATKVAVAHLLRKARKAYAVKR